VALCREILQKKTKEYTGDDTDRLGAFKAAAALQHTTPERALAGMLAKHIVSLYDMCFADGVSFDAGTWDEKITDSLSSFFSMALRVGWDMCRQSAACVMLLLSAIALNCVSCVSSI